jgi:phage-related protein
MGIRLNYFDNDFTRGIREANRNTNSFRDSMRGAATSADGLIGKLGALAVALGGIAVGKKAFDWLIGSNADMEQYQNTLTVVLGSAEEATRTLAWANKFAAQTPFEIPQVVEATTKMAAYGISAEKTLGVVGDMASVMGKDLMQAVEAVADAQTGEVERLKEFGITKGMIQDQAKALGTNPIDSKGSITDMTAFNAALFALMEKRFKGGMAMQATSYKGMLSNASDFVATLGRNLGKPLFDRAKKNLANYLEFLNKLQENGAIDRFISKVHQFGAVVGNEMAYAQKVIVGAFKAARKASAPVFQYIKTNWQDIKPFVQGVAIAIGAVVGVMTAMKTYTMAATIAMRLLSAAMLTNPIGWIILGIGLLIGLFIKMNGGMDGAKKKLIDMWNFAKKFGQAIAAIWNNADPSKLIDLGFSDGFNRALYSIIDTAWYVFHGIAYYAKYAVFLFKTYWPQIQATALAVFSALVNHFKWMQQQAIKYWPIIKAVALTVLNALGAAFRWIQQQAMKYWPTISGIAMGVVNDLVNGFKLIQAVAKRVWPMIQNTMLHTWEAVQQNVIPTVKLLLSVAVKAFKSIMAVALPLGAAIYNFFKAIAPTVLMLVGIIAWAVTTILWPAIMLVYKVIGQLAAAVIPVVVQIATSIVGAFTKVLNWVTAIWPAISKIILAAFVIIMAAWTVLGPFIMAALSTIGSIIVGGFQVIMAVVKFVWNTITSIISIAWAIISGLIQTALGLLTGDWKMAWEGIKTIFEGIWNGIIDFFGGLGSLFYDSGKAIITTLVDGIKSMAMAPVNAVKGVMEKVREFLPFSDAKKGPLSQLTYSGGAVMTTLATGVNKQQGVLQDAVSNAFAGTNMGMNVTATASGATMAPGASFSAAGTNIAPTGVNAVAAPAAKAGGDINVASLVGKIEVHTQPGDNADDLLDQFIDRLHTRAKEAAAILTSADKGALV